MTLANWFPLALICLMGAMSPGPSLALILRNTLQGGRRQGMATALGHGTGVGLYALLTAMGLSLLLTRTPWLFELIRYAGALFLALLGLQALLPQKPKAEATSQHTTSRRRGALEGFAVAFLNPQLAIFFLALFSQFVQQQTSWAQGGLLLLTAGGIDALWYLLVAGIFSHGRLLPWLTRHQRQLQRLSGLLLLAIALRVLWVG